MDCPFECKGDRLTCACPEGTVIDEEQNKCVSQDECPQSMAAICIITHVH